MIHNILKERSIKLYIILAGFFITNALIAEVIGVKIFSLEATLGFEPITFSLLGQSDLSFSLTAGVILWPIVFIMTDVINEYYGMRGVRYLSYLAVGLIAYAFFAFTGAIGLTPPAWWINAYPNVPDMQQSYTAVLGQSNWIIIGSLVAFLVGQVVDVFVFHRIKKLTGEKRVWLRATGSTIISQFIDSYVVLIIAFYWGAGWSIQQVLAIGTVNYIYKFIMAVVLTPAIYLSHYGIDRYLGHSLAVEMKQAAMRGKV
ncbi:queuosine precursor transporter [Aridibaculum aurantiacum]|uniref:queuosine precursor transporter n=1 Tax=Aridibaculum aurantiacum TaxID=2810307 RepID=UPI001A972663|nr:queuosine precursor transporter [Aridibaculum aurantiacum]